MCDHKPGTRCSTHAGEANDLAAGAYTGDATVDPLTSATVVADAEADPVLRAELELAAAEAASLELDTTYRLVALRRDRLGSVVEDRLRAVKAREEEAKVAVQRANLDHLDAGDDALDHVERLYREAGVPASAAARYRERAHDLNREDGWGMVPMHSAPVPHGEVDSEHKAEAVRACELAQSDGGYLASVARFNASLERQAAARAAERAAIEATEAEGATDAARAYVSASDEAYELGERARSASFRVMGARAALERAHSAAAASSVA